MCHTHEWIQFWFNLDSIWPGSDPVLDPVLELNPLVGTSRIHSAADRLADRRDPPADDSEAFFLPPLEPYIWTAVREKSFQLFFPKFSQLLWKFGNFAKLWNSFGLVWLHLGTFKRIWTLVDTFGWFRGFFVDFLSNLESKITPKAIQNSLQRLPNKLTTKIAKCTENLMFFFSFCYFGCLNMGPKIIKNRADIL